MGVAHGDHRRILAPAPLPSGRRPDAGVPVAVRAAARGGRLFVVASVALAAVVRGLPPYFALAGLAAIPLLVGAGFFGPKIGIGLYLSAAITGQLVGSVLLDHVGAFGTQVYRIDLERALGVAALVVGVVLVRGIRW